MANHAAHEKLASATKLAPWFHARRPTDRLTGLSAPGLRSEVPDTVAGIPAATIRLHPAT
ncbi:MAG: hypothetical protein NT171_11755 [Planctomycetota bacterium]|nr:hypothetical protein [Planctomycetota bacterium]